MFKLTLLLALLSSSVLANVDSACEAELKNLCTDENKRMVCLYENYEKASVGCKEALDRASGVAKTVGVKGGGGLNAFGAVAGALGLMGVNKTVIRYSGSLSPEPTPARFVQNGLHLSTPLHNGSKWNSSLSLAASRLDFGTRPRLEGEKISSTWDRTDIGTTLTRKLGEGKSWGSRLSVGSASDDVFASKDEVTVNANAFYLKPGSGEDYWAYTLFISNNSPILNYIPIPGFIYFHRNKTVTGMYGLPFLNVQWAPVDPWIFSVSIFLVNGTLEAAYGQRNELQFFSGFSTQQHSYLRSNRDNNRDRMFYSEKKLYLGSRLPLFSQVMAEFQVGQSFDRQISEGKRFNDAKREHHFARSLYLTGHITFLY